MQHVFFRYPNLVQHELRGDRGAQRKLALDVARRKARPLSFYQKPPDSVGRFGPNDCQVRDGAIGNPTFRTVEDPVTPVAVRTRFHPSGVRAVVGFRESKAANHLALGHVRQPTLLLFLGAKCPNRVHAQRALNRNHGAQPAVATLEFLANETVGNVVEPGATVAVKVRSEQTELRHARNQMARKFLARVTVFDDRQSLVFHELAHGALHHALLWGEQVVEVVIIHTGKTLHRWPPCGDEPYRKVPLAEATDTPHSLPASDNR
jgi:hypothetical protein